MTVFDIDVAVTLQLRTDGSDPTTDEIAKEVVAAAEAGDFDADIIENLDATRQAELDDWVDQWRDEKIAEELDHDEY